MILLIVNVLAAGAWFYVRRSQQRIDLATYVPESALGYLEVKDWPQLLDDFASTKAWQQLAPAYGVENRLDYLGRIGWLARLGGSSEPAILARSQFAIVITGIEVEGDQIRPQLALIAATHSGEEAVRKVIDARLPELARRIYGREAKQTSEYGGVKLESYAAKRADRQLLSAQIGGEWILANHLQSMRACIDTRLGRSPSMANNFYLRNTRPLVSPDGNLFGFVTGEGVARLSRFGAFLLASGAMREKSIADFLQDVVSDLAARASDGIAYGASFENGEVIDRHALLVKPGLVDKLKPAIKVNPGLPQAFNYIPPAVKEATIINVQDPHRTLDGIEAAVSAHLGVAQSFLLHQFLLSTREAIFGGKAGAQSPIGNEIATFGFNDRSEDRVWLIAARDRGSLTGVIERYLSLNGATVQRQAYQGVEILKSSEARRGAAAFIGEFVALGGSPQLVRLIETHRRGQSLKTAPGFAAAGSPPGAAAVLSLSSVKEDSNEAMVVLARWLGGQPNPGSGPKALDQLPFSISSTSLNEQGLYIESHSPFGNLPFLVLMVDGAAEKSADGAARR
ncbi:MAG TPA: hypothetical protein VJ302_08125 [Blastocatellia bacterium]|nr:hypothetical protein [Blastocatellia bacterium]